MQRRSSPIVLRANHYQFGPGEQHSFGPVKSCMQLWCRAGRGVVSTADAELELVAGREQRLLARLLLHEWRLVVRQTGVPRASPDLGLLELYVRDHLEARLDLATLSRVLEVSPSSVHRLVRRASGLSPAAWVQRLRIEE